MTFLWKKKSRVARISQGFVADLHSPSKNCDSLVVETGFPTSLVDLVVKNKNRLKKLSSRRNQDDDDQDDDQDWEISDPVLTSPLPPHLVCPEACVKLVEFESGGSGYDGNEIEVARNSEVINVPKTGGDPGISGKNVLFVNVVKVLVVVVVVVLSIRRFAAAVAISAVLLLLLELIRRRSIRSPLPCADARMHCQGISSRAHNFFRTVSQFRNKSKHKETSADVAERDVDREDCNLTDKISEIDGAALVDNELVVTADSSFVECEREGGSLDSGIKIRKAKLKRDEYFYGVAEHEDRRHNQDFKLKAKFMKMIVPKKLKNPKTGRRNTVSCAMLYEVEQPLKENRGKVKEDEVQIHAWKEQFEDRETRRKCTKAR